jgi:hypothetical protein
MPILSLPVISQKYMSVCKKGILSYPSFEYLSTMYGIDVPNATDRTCKGWKGILSTNLDACIIHQFKITFDQTSPIVYSLHKTSTIGPSTAKDTQSLYHGNSI